MRLDGIQTLLAMQAQALGSGKKNNSFWPIKWNSKNTLVTFKRNLLQNIILETFRVPSEIKGLQTELDITETQLPGRP